MDEVIIYWTLRFQSHLKWVLLVCLLLLLTQFGVGCLFNRADYRAFYRLNSKGRIIDGLGGRFCVRTNSLDQLTTSYKFMTHLLLYGVPARPKIIDLPPFANKTRNKDICLARRHPLLLLFNVENVWNLPEIWIWLESLRRCSVHIVVHKCWWFCLWGTRKWGRCV